MVLKINNKEVCNSMASYGGEGHVTKGADGKVMESLRETSICAEVIKVSKGDKIAFQANYDLNLHPSREDVDSHGGTAGTAGMGSVGSMGGMGGKGTVNQGAEQMALFITYFAPTS